MFYQQFCKSKNNSTYLGIGNLYCIGGGNLCWYTFMKRSRTGNLHGWNPAKAPRVGQLFDLTPDPT